MTEQQINIKIEFLTSAITDAQELIKFTDTKAAIVITILSAYAVAFFPAIEDLFNNPMAYGICFWVFSSIYLVFFILSITITARIINPTNNPIENLDLPKDYKSTLAFYIGENTYKKKSFYQFKNSSEHKLNESLENYSKSLNDADEYKIIESLALELLKVSFIRNIKNDRFKTLLWFLLVTTIFFIISYILYEIETPKSFSVLDTFICN